MITEKEQADYLIIKYFNYYVYGRVEDTICIANISGLLSGFESCLC